MFTSVSASLTLHYVCVSGLQKGIVKALEGLRLTIRYVEVRGVRQARDCRVWRVERASVALISPCVDISLYFYIVIESVPPYRCVLFRTCRQTPKSW